MGQLNLVILAAGLGSRFKGNKQCVSVGPQGKWLLDYSIYDALKAGFKRIILVIREELRAEVTEHFCSVFGDDLNFELVVQDIDQLPENYKRPELRKKPWGTVHALWSIRNVIGPHDLFASINADDFYGREAFMQMTAELSILEEERVLSGFLMGYQLGRSLSAHGGVTRGICKLNEQRELLEIVECRDLVMTEEGKVESRSTSEYYSPNMLCSMNFWGFDARIFELLEASFVDFLKEHGHSVTSEFVLPDAVNMMVKDHKKMMAIPTNSRWFGMTFREDLAAIKKFLVDLEANNEYPTSFRLS